MHVHYRRGQCPKSPYEIREVKVSLLPLSERYSGTNTFGLNLDAGALHHVAEATPATCHFMATIVER